MELYSIFQLGLTVSAPSHCLSVTVIGAVSSGWQADVSNKTNLITHCSVLYLLGIISQPDKVSY